MAFVENQRSTMKYPTRSSKAKTTTTSNLRSFRSRPRTSCCSLYSSTNVFCLDTQSYYAIYLYAICYLVSYHSTLSFTDNFFSILELVYFIHIRFAFGAGKCLLLQTYILITSWPLRFDCARSRICIQMFYRALLFASSFKFKNKCRS